MQLTALLSEEVVRAPLEAFDKEEAIAELLEVLVRAGRVADREGVMRALYEREDKGTTGIGGGVAIPHAKHESITGVELAAGVSPDGIEFDAVDGELVHVVFVVVAEEHNPGPNVEILAEIGDIMQTPGVSEKLTAAGSPADVVKILEEAEGKL